MDSNVPCDCGIGCTQHVLYVAYFNNFDILTANEVMLQRRDVLPNTRQLLPTAEYDVIAQHRRLHMFVKKYP